MSVIIRGMKMPKNCTACPFFIKSNSPKYPFVDCKIIGRLGSVFNCIGIPVDCPLVELPPHGRLIDADELVADIKGQAERLWTLDSVSERDYFIERNEKFRQAMFKAWCESLFAYLDTRPTIIEREVAE